VLTTVLFVLCLPTFVLGWVLGRVANWNQIDTLSVILSALGAILTALGIGIAVLALWGYQSLKAEALRRTDEIATKVAAEKAAEVAAAVAARTVEAAGKVLSSQTGTRLHEEDDYGRAAEVDDP